MGVTIRGKVETKGKVKKFKGELEKAAGETAERSAKSLYKESQIEVPKKTGALAGSGRFIIHSAGGPFRSWGVIYGYDVADSDDEEVIDYAAAVHEILKASHAPPTKAKFVEEPLIQGLVYYKRVGVAEVKKAVKRSFR